MKPSCADGATCRSSRSAHRGCAGVAGGIGGGSGEAVVAVGERRRGLGPGPAALATALPKQRRTVKRLDRCVGFCRPAQGQRIVVGDAIAHRAAIGQNETIVGAAGTTVSIVTLSAPRGCAGVAGGIGGGSGGLWLPLASAAPGIGQAPLPLAATLPNSVAPSNTLTVALASASRSGSAYCRW